jgi:hypothetical protein
MENVLDMAVTKTPRDEKDPRDRRRDNLRTAFLSLTSKDWLGVENGKVVVR